jgi:hypothetical protein
MDTVEKEGGGENAKFVPPKLWTAWPMEPKAVPRRGERVGVGDGAERFTFKRMEVERPSRELEEILVGVVLKKAKEKFLARSFEDDEEEGGRDTSASSAGGKQTGLSHDDTSGNDSIDAAQQIFTEMDTRRPIEQSSDDGSEYQPDGPIATIEFVPLKQPSEALSMPPNLKAPDAPVISTDDERSRQLLRPTIRHTLARLDSLLTALHHSRQACLNYDSETSENQSPTKDSSAAETSTSTKRPVGRPRKIINYDEAPLPSDRGRKSARGRKKKLHTPLPGESHHEMLVRIAREQKKAIPFPSSPSQSQPTSRSPSRARSSSNSRARRAAKLNPRDWSEVLGAAALIGFPSGVVSRAATRCAKLFGEGMVMRELVEKVVPGEVGDTTMVYHPDMIPDLPLDDADSDSDAEVQHEGMRTRNRSASVSPMKRFGRRARSRSCRPSHSHGRSRSRTGTPGTPGTPDVGTLEQLDDRLYTCPLPTCTRATTGSGFVSLTALKSHLAHAHKMGKEEVEKAVERDEGGGEMLGGVHRDGFLKPLRRRKGWRGVDRSPVKRVRGPRKKGEGNEVDEKKGEENVVVESDDEVLDADIYGGGDENIADADDGYDESGGDVEEVG